MNTADERGPLEDRINEIVDRYGADRTASLAVLQDIQREYNYLPREALELTAQRLGMSNGEVYRLATFFTSFSLQPKGKYMCKVCLGTACHVLGSPRLLETLERELGIKSGETTPDGRFSLEGVRCLGACALGPMVLVNDRPYSRMTPPKVEELIEQLSSGELAPEPAEAVVIEIGPPAPVDLSAVPPAG